MNDENGDIIFWRAQLQRVIKLNYYCYSNILSKRFFVCALNFSIKHKYWIRKYVGSILTIDQAIDVPHVILFGGEYLFGRIVTIVINNEIFNLINNETS